MNNEHNINIISHFFKFAILFLLAAIVATCFFFLLAFAEPTG